MTEPALPFLTEAIPGIGGVIRSTPEDFRVEERPLYLPCGQGEHLYLSVTKRGITTQQLVSWLSSRLGIKAATIGVAGLKDARAVTTQMVSVHGVDPDRIGRLRPDEAVQAVTLLGRHRNRLRKGHHAGNVFHLVVREVRPHAAEAVPAALELLARRGLPNYFGPQRQGRKGQNYALGAALLTDPARRASLSRHERLWYLHAYQSFLFNRILARRLPSLDRVLAGDWAMKHDNGACFLVENEAAEQPRADAFAISPTGPLFGSRAPWAGGLPGEIEGRVVEEEGTTREALQRAAAACGFRGERRPLRVRLEGLQWALDGDNLSLSFTLPPGSYATSLLRELTKSESWPKTGPKGG